MLFVVVPFHVQLQMRLLQRLEINVQRSIEQSKVLDSNTACLKDLGLKVIHFHEF